MNENGSSAKDDENLWASVLGEVQTSRSSALPSSKNILVLGDKESGKTTLIAKLAGNEDPKKGAGLEYGFINVRDEEREDQTRLGHWILDGDMSHSHLLRFALKESNFRDTTLLLCVAMTTPWNIMDQLQTWASLLHDHIDRLALTAEQTKQLQNENIRRWQSYCEPGDDTESSSTTQQSSSSPTKHHNNMSRSRMDASANDADGLGLLGGSATGNDLEAELEPLAEDTLTRNLGLDLIVVVTKTDYMSDLERDYDYKDEHFDFIQQYVRKFCLQFGASLFYVSVKDDKNCDLLYKYLVHRIYAFPFRTPALVVEKDAVFIPAGWDSSKKIGILYENMHSVKPDQYYTDVIAKPMVSHPSAAGGGASSSGGQRSKPTSSLSGGGSSREVEVVAEDMAVFLARQQAYLQGSGGGVQPGPVHPGQPGSPVNQAGGGGGGGSKGHSQDPRKSIGSVSPGGQNSPKKDPPKGVGPGGANTSEGVLANFFNSLLNKKTGQGMAGGGISPAGAQIKPQVGNDEYKAAVRSDAAAELDRLTRKKSVTSGSNGPASATGGGSNNSSANNSIDNNSLNNSTDC